MLRSYTTRKFDFLFGTHVNITPDSPKLSKLSTAIEDILKKLSCYFRSLNEPVPAIDFKMAAKMFSELGIENDIITELIEFFDLIQSNNQNEILKGYKALKRVNSNWGCSLHFVSIRKDATIAMHHRKQSSL